MIIKINEKTGLQRFKELICGSKPQCAFCGENNIKTKVKQFVGENCSNCLTFFCGNLRDKEQL